VHWAKTGAFTGETSPLFLKELNITFSLVGHSERRTYFGETSETVAMRAEAGLAEGLTVIVCVGETEGERSGGSTEKVLEEQLQPILARLSASHAPRVVIAYEPVWAIGTGKVASLEDIATTHRFIQQRWNAQGYDCPPTILYGGSVNPQNFADILALKEVDGALVGGASIKLDQWLELIRIAEATQI
jgi:triosephosphate isomerase